MRSVARYVCSPTRIPSTGAADCSRAAVFTTSPDAMPSPSDGRAPNDTSASPVLTPIRTLSSLSSVTQSRIASAARTARSGSSSCATGAPKSATTASPMNFSTVPPKCSSSDRSRCQYGASMARTSSGSSCSDREVNPTRSANSTVTTLRSSRRAALVGWRGAPHIPHIRNPSGFSWPQLGQIIGCSLSLWNRCG